MTKRQAKRAVCSVLLATLESDLRSSEWPVELAEEATGDYETNLARISEAIDDLADEMARRSALAVRPVREQEGTRD